MRITKNILDTLINTFRIKIIAIWTRIRRWTNPAYLKAKFLQKIRIGFTKLLDVRPRDKSDYYSVFRWLVSKRLAYALVVVVGLISAMYLLNIIPIGFFENEEPELPIYGYRSIPLKFYEGPAQIEARGGYIAYEGQVSKGTANGEGKLFDAEGNLVYEGAFVNSRYNGTGTKFYPKGIPQYRGTFADNLFHGTGSYYHPTGTLEYEGDYVAGVRTGVGTLCNAVGDPVYKGRFLNNDVIYSDFLSRPTKEVAELYSGRAQVYQSTDEYCVKMDEINALYSVRDGSKTLENEWTVDRIYVLQPEIQISGNRCNNIGQLQKLLGEPLYYGVAWISLPEAVAWNELAEETPNAVIPIEIKAEPTLEDVFDVSSYNRNAQVYLYTFEKDGLLYTFYSTDSGASDFLMYAMEQAD